MIAKNRSLRPTVLALALASCFPALARSNAEILNELRALCERFTELENKLKAAEAKTPASSGATQWGVTPEQVRDHANLPALLNVKDGTFKKSNSLFGASVLVAF